MSGFMSEEKFFCFRSWFSGYLGGYVGLYQKANFFIIPSGFPAGSSRLFSHRLFVMAISSVRIYSCWGNLKL